MDGTISVYKLVGDRAIPLRDVELKDQPKEVLLATLAAMRAGLPSDCGASLKDPQGRNIRP